MTASLHLHLLSKLEKDVQDFDFFKAECWTVEAEQQLLAKLQDLLASIHPYANAFEININVDVNDLKSAAFLIKKKAKRAVVINTQHLTLREIEVLGLIMKGMTNQEIANKLFVSYETIKSHRKNILHKTGARNTAALVNYYHQAFFDK